MRNTLLVGLALLAALPAPAVAVTESGSPQAASYVDAELHASSMRLAAILYTERSQIDAGLRAIDQTLIPAFRQQKEFQELEQQYPGLLTKLAVDLRPVFERSIRRDLPKYHRLIADLLATRFSKAEIDELVIFYSGPTGSRLIAAIMENISYDAVAKEALASPGEPTSFTAVQADHRAAVSEAAKSLGKEDEAALLALTKKPYFIRLATIGPAVRRIEQDFTNAPDPQLEAELEAAMASSFAQHIASFEKTQGAK